MRGVRHAAHGNPVPAGPAQQAHPLKLLLPAGYVWRAPTALRAAARHGGRGYVVEPGLRSHCLRTDCMQSVPERRQFHGGTTA